MLQFLCKVSLEENTSASTFKTTAKSKLFFAHNVALSVFFQRYRVCQENLFPYAIFRISAVVHEHITVTGHQGEGQLLRNVFFFLKMKESLLIKRHKPKLNENDASTPLFLF